MAASAPLNQIGQITFPPADISRKRCAENHCFIIVKKHKRMQRALSFSTQQHQASKRR